MLYPVHDDDYAGQFSTRLHDLVLRSSNSLCWDPTFGFKEERVALGEAIGKANMRLLEEGNLRVVLVLGKDARSRFYGLCHSGGCTFGDPYVLCLGFCDVIIPLHTTATHVRQIIIECPAYDGLGEGYIRGTRWP